MQRRAVIASTLVATLELGQDGALVFEQDLASGETNLEAVHPVPIGTYVSADKSAA